MKIFIVMILFYLVLGVAKRNPNLTLIFAFLHKLVSIMKDYFNILEEESIRYVLGDFLIKLFQFIY